MNTFVHRLAGSDLSSATDVETLRPLTMAVYKQLVLLRREVRKTNDVVLRVAAYEQANTETFAKHEKEARELRQELSQVRARADVVLGLENMTKDGLGGNGKKWKKRKLDEK